MLAVAFCSAPVFFLKLRSFLFNINLLNVLINIGCRSCQMPSPFFLLLHSFLPSSFSFFQGWNFFLWGKCGKPARLRSSGEDLRLSGSTLGGSLRLAPHPPLARVGGTCKAQSYSRGRGRSHRAQGWMERSRQHSARLPWSAKTAQESCAGPAVGLRLPWRSGQAAPQGGGPEVPGYAVPMVQKRPAEAQVPRRHA